MLFDVLKKNCGKYAQKPAIIYRDQAISYDVLFERVCYLAAGLGRLGVERENTVAIISENTDDFVVLFFALARLGVRLLPINTSYSAPEISNIMGISGVSWLFSDSRHQEICEKSLELLTVKPYLVGIDKQQSGGDELSLASILATGSKLLNGNLKLLDELVGVGKPEDDFIILFSSGSTGRPKRMARSQASYLFELEGFLALTSTSDKDSILCTVPLYHSHGIGSCLLPSIGAGGTLVILESAKTDAGAPKEIFIQRLDRVFELISKYEISVFPGIPYIFQAILDAPTEKSRVVKAIRYSFSSGNFLSEKLHEQYLHRFGVPLFQVYGCSEAGAVAINAPGIADDNHLSVGVPLPGIEIKIQKENEEDAQAGEIGEVLFKAPSTTSGYMDFPDLTERAFANAFFRSGDLGKLDAGGRLTITGRKKLLIDTGGKKVDPYEIEDVISRCDGVRESVVLGVKSVTGNEWIKAVIAAEPDIEPLLREHCSTFLANYKIPRIFQFVDHIPKSATGKILRKDLINSDDIEQITLDYLTKLLKTSLEADGDIEDLDFDALGIDSATMVELNHQLEKHFQFLPKTLFFELRTVRELSEYLAKNHRDKTDSKLRQLNAGSAQVENDIPVNSKTYDHRAEDIAIIGISGQYPGAEDLQQFQQVLRDGRDCITDIPSDRWDWREYFSNADEKGKSYSKWGGFLQNVFQFDADLFSITPVEAEVTDPQERLFLQQVWAALEDAGYCRKHFFDGEISNNVGVFAGVMWGDYQLYSMHKPDFVEADGALSKSHFWSIANRVSYFFNMTGPSLVIDTACSSSLSAIHLACQSLKNGECDWAVAGGVNLILHPRRYQLLTLGKFASTDGRCRSFGEGGDGYVPAEGVGVVVLKPLSKALEAGDNIYAVIKGSAVNHGGKTKAFTVPDPKAQGEVIRKALSNAGIRGSEISYIEAHGTGTSLGDPIEIRGLGFGLDVEERTHKIPIGSVKSNIGHCESAAGIAGLSKILLQFKTQQLFASLHAWDLNPEIDFEHVPFQVIRETQSWQRTADDARIASLSSFGAGGANGHLVVQEYLPERRKASADNEEYLFVFSARNPERLKALVSKWILAINISDDGRIVFMQQPELPRLYDVAFTLAEGRESLPSKLAIVCRTWVELKDQLQSALREIADNSLLKSTVSSQRLNDIATDWLNGKTIDWRVIFKPGRRISLPTYPFAKTRYCVEKPLFSLRTEQSINSSQGNRHYFLEKRWIQVDVAELPGRSCDVLVVVGTKHTLKIIDNINDLWNQTKIVRIMTGQGKVTTEFGVPLDPYRYESGAACYKSIYSDLANAHSVALLDLTAVDKSYENSLQIEVGKIALLQLLLNHHRQSALLFLQVVHKLVCIDEEKLYGQGARMAGLYRMLSAEYQGVRSAVVDIDTPLNHHRKLAIQTTNELSRLQQEYFAECVVRGNHRYLPQIVEIASIQADPSAHLYHKDDVVLITGGSRGLGREVLNDAFNSGARKFAIFGREALPDTKVSKGKATDVSEKNLFFQSLKNRGAELYYFNTPLDDKKSLAGTINEITTSLGAVSVVFHCAGVANNTSPFISKTGEDFINVANPKVVGLANLFDLVNGPTLKSFQIFSSIAAVINKLAVGQSDYAMANAFIDFFVQLKRSEGAMTVRSIQWGAWAETGMSASEDQHSSVYASLGLRYMSNEAGLSMLKSAVNTDTTVLCAFEATADFSLAKLQNNARNSISLDLPKDTHKQTSAVEYSPGIMSWLKDVFVRELKLSLDVLDENRLFSDYGIESVLLTQLTQVIQKRISAKLSPALLLEYPNFAELCRYFMENHAHDFDVEAEAAPLNPKADAYQTRPLTASADSDVVVVVGMAGRFPGALNKDQYWQNLSEGRVSISALSSARWITGDASPVFGGWIDGIEFFDPGFFKLNERDARIMDPQGRVLLEESLAVFCDAGYHLDELAGKRLGVFIGARAQQLHPISTVLDAPNPVLGIGQNYLATNISRFFNLNGPSVVVDTACSSGITALQMAADALLQRRIEGAVVGTSSLLLNSSAHDVFAARNILSPEGKFNIFDRRASGEVLGEGVGVVLLKRLSDAIKDGDRVYAAIETIAINNDGKTLGPGSPNIQSQRIVMEEALNHAKLSASDVGYIEVNAGGSSIVDAIEIKAISDVYQLQNNTLPPVHIGSIKPNVGHLLLSSGLASFIRCVLSVYHGQIPPYLSTQEPFDFYDFASSRIAMNRTAIPWPTTAGPRIAVQNCFPDGGTNCHLIVRQIEQSNRSARQAVAMPILERRYFTTFTAREEVGSSVLKEQAAIYKMAKVENVWGRYEASL